MAKPELFIYSLWRSHLSTEVFVGLMPVSKIKRKYAVCFTHSGMPVSLDYRFRFATPVASAIMRVPHAPYFG